MEKTIDRLLRERQMTALRDRRQESRSPFVRPVRVLRARHDPSTAISRDISAHGIALIDQTAWERGTQAILAIHSLFGPEVQIRAEVRWKEPYGEGWFVSGWHFLDEV